MIFKRVIDRSQWIGAAKGPWDDEDDLIMDKYMKHLWMVFRHPNLGHLCGYFVVHTNKLLRKHKCNFFDSQYWDLNIHGGVTYKEDHFPQAKELLVGKFKLTKHDLIVGFDCGHCNDFSPCNIMSTQYLFPAEYRTIEYVIKEIKFGIEEMVLRYQPRFAYPLLREKFTIEEMLSSDNEDLRSLAVYVIR